jgi:hypothetical protein
MKHEILLGLTTTPASNWKEKCREIKTFEIKKIALFPTFLKIADRKILYGLLDEILDLEIPHVHLRAEDMEEWEMDWFEKKGAVVYNLHPSKDATPELEKYNKKIYIENHPSREILEQSFKKYAGICLDFQHWEIAKKKNISVAEKTQYFADNFKIGCCHISALPTWKNFFKRLLNGTGGHYMMNLDELNYIKKYHKYFPQYLSIELENSFTEQLKVKAYLEKILDI